MKSLTTMVQNSNIYDNDIIIDQHLDEGIPPLAPFDDSELPEDLDDSELPEDLVSSDPWSPPVPSSMPFSPGSLQTLPPVDQQSAASDVPVVSLAGLHKEFHPCPSLWVPGGRNLLQRIDESDEYAPVRASSANIHYPFASHSEWHLAKWLATAPLSRADIDKFLHLDYVSRHSSTLFK